MMGTHFSFLDPAQSFLHTRYEEQKGQLPDNSSYAHYCTVKLLGVQLPPPTPLSRTCYPNVGRHSLTHTCGIKKTRGPLGPQGAGHTCSVRLQAHLTLPPVLRVNIQYLSSTCIDFLVYLFFTLPFLLKKYVAGLKPNLCFAIFDQSRLIKITMTLRHVTFFFKWTEN